MSGSTLEIVLSICGVWGLAHGLKALKHWKRREPMKLSFWQGGLIGRGKIVRGASLWVLGWTNLALVVAVGLWIGGAVPFDVGKTVAIALCIPGLVITLAAKEPALGEPELPEVPRATVETQSAKDPGIPRR
jgi:hypothetical protein